MKQILIKNIGAKDYALFYQELSNVVGEYCYSFEIDDEFESQVDVKIANIKEPRKCAGCEDLIYYQEYCPNCNRLWET